MRPETRARHAYLLTAPPGATEDQLWAQAGEFTRRCCYDERGRYALIRKRGGRVCDGVDCDKVIERSALWIYDLVRGAGAPGAVPIFDFTGHTGTVADFVEPPPYDVPPEPPPLPPVQLFPPYLGDAYYIEHIGVPLQADYREAGQLLNAGAATWFARPMYDIMAGMTPETAIAKHRPVWRHALGLSPVR